MTYSESRLSEFERAIAQIVADKGVAQMKEMPNVSTKGIDPKKFEELQAQVAELMSVNAVLQAEAALAKKTPARRV
jgi:hypothetical protein